MKWVYCPRCGNPLTFTRPAPEEYEAGFSAFVRAPISADETVLCEAFLSGSWRDVRQHAAKFGPPSEINLTGRQVDTVNAFGQPAKDDVLTWLCGWQGTLTKITVVDKRTECHCIVNGEPVVLIVA